MSVTTPNFFIVGAPKCGTTTVWHYLSKHYEIYLSRVKEPHHFCFDLKIPWSIRNQSQYMSLFQDAKQEKIIGEASATYLYSKVAASNIHTFAPSAKILICLRNPVEMMYALHSQYVYSLVETERDFIKALALEEKRRLESRSLLLQYRAAARYSTQIQRFSNLFAAEKIHFLLIDDLVLDIHRAIDELLCFLGVDRDVKITSMARAVNPNSTWRSLGLARANMRLFGASPSHRWRWALYCRLARWNNRVMRRPALPAVLYNRLLDECLPDIEATEKLIGRNLSAWKCAQRA